MSNCGCKPCSKAIAKKSRVCKPFSFCAGNKTIIWDGECLMAQPRSYEIPDGTYTSITFAGGCVVDVGQAPVPQYTPQACCSDEDTGNNGNSGSSLIVSPVPGNLATISAGMLSVVPSWDARGNIAITGLGTATNPWKPSLKISSKANNDLKEVSDGLFVHTYFSTTNTVTVTGDGSETSPYKLNVQGADAKLPEVNKVEVVGNGFKIDKQGRMLAGSDLSLVTNLAFDNDAFSVVNSGTQTLVVVDEVKLKTGSTLKTGDGLTGAGTTAAPLKLVFTTAVVNQMLDVISGDAALKAKLKTIVGV